MRAEWLTAISSFAKPCRVYLTIFLCLISTETISERHAKSASVVQIVYDMLTSKRVAQIIISSLEDVVAVGFHRQPVAFQWLTRDGSIDITRNKVFRILPSILFGGQM